ncbi:hypothetical protein C8R44DRAFT_778073 [Mycena epipterygia]|nr:hypothetical protein C8R44DRAFT_778073 [Mycena epipterygia]
MSCRDPEASEAEICTKPLSIEAQRTTIDSEIAWHYAQIALLMSKRNTIAPIGSLTNELLSRILTIYAVDSGTLFTLEWTQVMYVCRH